MFFDAKKTTKIQVHNELTAMTDAPANSCMMIPLTAYFRIMARSNTNEIIGGKETAYKTFFTEVMEQGKLLWHYPESRKPLGATLLNPSTWHRTKTVWAMGNIIRVPTKNVFTMHKISNYLRPRIQANIWESTILNRHPAIQASLIGFAFFEKDAGLEDTRFVGPDAPLTGKGAFPAAVVNIPLFGWAGKESILNNAANEGIGLGRARNKADRNKIRSYFLSTIAPDLKECIQRSYKHIVQDKTTPFDSMQFCMANKKGGLSVPILGEVQTNREILKKLLGKKGETPMRVNKKGENTQVGGPRLFDGFDHLEDGVPAMWRIGLKPTAPGEDTYEIKSRIIDDPIMLGYGGLKKGL